MDSEEIAASYYREAITQAQRRANKEEKIVGDVVWTPTELLLLAIYFQLKVVR